jgi:hypothetical protein
MSDAGIAATRPQGNQGQPGRAPAPAAPAAPAAAQAAAAEAGRIVELRVSGHLMALDTGLFCIFHTPVAAPDGSGLPGVRISLPPSPASRPENVTIQTFREDGWLGGHDDAALVRVVNAPAQVLVTIYQSPAHGPDTAPRLQVVKLSGETAAGGAPRAGAGAGAGAPAQGAEVMAHIQRSGDVGGAFGEWLGVRGSQRWIEGFSLNPAAPLKPEDIEYQAVLGRGWLSPWVEGGKYCGSRGMALPLLGIRVRLKGEAARTHEMRYSATFVDGSAVGPTPAGEACEAESLAPLEAMLITLTPRDGAGRAAAPRAAARPAAAPAPAPAAAPAARARTRTASTPARAPKPVPPRRGR